MRHSLRYRGVFLGTMCIVTFVAAWLRPQFAWAGSSVIGQVFPAPTSGTTSYIGGIAFDGGPNPLVIDGRASAVQRLDVTNASVLGTQALNFNVSTRCLEYDAPTGTYLTSHLTGGDYLARINLANSTDNVVGSFANFNFNFLALAEDPSGNLWMMTDYDTSTTFATTIYLVNKATGAATLQRRFTSIARPTSMGIDDAGRFFIFTYSPSNSVQSNIYQIDPFSGDSSLITQTGMTGADFFIDVAYSPTNGRWYGIEERRSTARSWYLREITGLPSAVPEPAGVGVWSLFALGLLKRRNMIRGSMKRGRI